MLEPVAVIVFGSTGSWAVFRYHNPGLQLVVRESTNTGGNSRNFGCRRSVLAAYIGTGGVPVIGYPGIQQFVQYGHPLVHYGDLAGVSCGMMLDGSYSPASARYTTIQVPRLKV